VNSFLSAAVAVCLALSAALVGAAPAGASGKPLPVTFEIHKPTGSGPGTFTASGAVTDSGVAATSRFDAHYGAYPKNETAEVVQSLSGADGVIVVKMEVRVTQSGLPGVEDEHGDWQIVSGTGAYERLQGEGTENAVIDLNQGQLSRTLEGQVH
jgi:hypothetical protein